MGKVCGLCAHGIERVGLLLRAGERCRVLQKGVRCARTGWKGWVDYCARKAAEAMVRAGRLRERGGR